MTLSPPAVIGRSPALLRALAVAERFAPTRMPILLIGATGTGKEVFAQHIHHRSGRPGKLVPVNCAALPRDMVESLLFGHRRGAFTGAQESSAGLVEAAHRGTLFLDELPSLSVEAQAKLLRVLERQEVYRLGETEMRVSDFRVVASAQTDLTTRMQDGVFRLDLYQRVAGVVVELQPLSDRPEDIVPLAEYFAFRHGQRLQEGAQSVLLNYTWPGNVRELQAAVDRAGFLSEDGVLTSSTLAEAIAMGAPRGGSRAVVRGDESRASKSAGDELVAACWAHRCDASRVAAALGIGRSTLYRRLKAAHISLRRMRSEVRTAPF